MQGLVGEWKNELPKPSTLSIKSVDPGTGAIAGSYFSPLGAGQQAFPLVGWVNTLPPRGGKDNVVVISYTVRWGQIGSITAWNGWFRADGKQPVIVGQWLLSRPVTDYPWDHLLAGQDRYAKAAAEPTK